MRSKSGWKRHLLQNHTLRIVVSILFVLNTVLLTCTASCFAFLLKKNFYTTNAAQYRNEIVDRLMESRSGDALQYYRYYILTMASDDSGKSQAYINFRNAFSEKNSNFSFAFSKHGQVDFENYHPDECARIYTPDPEEFFKNSDFASLTVPAKLTFEARLKKDLTAHDMFWKNAQVFEHADIIKYAVLALLVFFVLTESLIGYMLCAAAGRRALAPAGAVHMRDIDHIPMYFLAPFFAIMASLCIYFLQQQTAVLSDLPRYFMGREIFTAELRPALYTFFLLLTVLAFLVHAMVTTISVRVKLPAWWRRSILYRTFSGNLDHRVRTTLVVLSGVEAALLAVLALSPVLFADIARMQPIFNWPAWNMLYLLADVVCIAIAAPLLYIIAKDMAVYIPATHRIALRQRGYISTNNLSESARHHAENINFLSRSASAETEKRFINENFSTKLIHNISHGLREPLNTVAEHVRELESGSLSPEEERCRIREIDTLSQELKKTIEDLIRISKATTGNLPFDPVPTDAGTMLSQAVGEFYEKFDARGIVPVTEQPSKPVMLLADGQYMWYVFEGILSVMLEQAVPGTRLFLSAAEAGGKAMLQFRCTVRADAGEQLSDLGGMGLSSAKAFTFLQNGEMHDKLSHDTLTAVLLFPKAES